MIIEFTENKFNEFIKDKKLFVIDYFATWCGPCKMFGPIYEEASKLEEYTKKNFNFVKLDVDQNTDFAADQGVTSVPTVIIYKDGKEFKRWSGALNLNSLKNNLNEALK